MKMGPGTENSDVKVGDRVGIKWLSAVCGSCRKQPRSTCRNDDFLSLKDSLTSARSYAAACLSGNDGVCFKQKISGYYVRMKIQTWSQVTIH